MAINNKDDYEKLAKILYPSIEASGNVYYGQTRKLTMDEILGKNELNFESHIETFKQGDQTYKSYFNWKIGPLKGAIQVESLDSNGEITLKNFPGQLQFNLFKYCDSYSSYIDDPDKDIHGTVFAKYILVKQSTPIPNIIQSASFTTYETTFSADLSGLYIADSNIIVIDNNTWFLFNDNRNFFITHEDYNDYLYIKIASRKHKSLYKDYIDKPFRITNLYNGLNTILLETDVEYHSINDRFKYNKNNEGWVDCDENNDTIINLKKGDYVELKITADAVDSKVLHFGTTGPFSISGNICSLYYADFAAIDYEFDYMNSDFFSQMFKSSTTLSDASKLSIPCQCASLSQMFYNCTNLVYPPELPATSLVDDCYSYMFYGCSSLKYVPDLSHVLELQNGCFAHMFENCTALEYPQDILPAVSLPYRCYYYMYSGCSSLKRTPLILSTSTSGNDCIKYMFNDCTSLKMSCISLQTLSIITSEYWLNNVSETGALFVTTTFDESSSANCIPQGWDIIRNDFSKLTIYNLYNGYYCDKYAYNEPYAKSILSASGSDCDTNGRGKIENQTKFNMLDVSPVISGNVNYSEYDANSGALNQEIWGYKCFNSPVSFRNGIYGDCASLTTADISSVDKIEIFQNGEPFIGYSINRFGDVIDNMHSCELKVLPRTDTFLPSYNPRAYLELLHVNSEQYTDDYKMSISQSGIYAHNKFDNNDKIRFINRKVINKDPISNTGEYSAFITSASINTDTDPDTVRFTEYIAIASAGDAYIKLIGGTDRDGNNNKEIELNADIIPNENNAIDIGNNDKKYGNIYATDVYASTFHGSLMGKTPSISKELFLTKSVINLSDCIGSIILLTLWPRRYNDTSDNTRFVDQDVVPGDNFKFYLTRPDYISNNDAMPTISDVHFVSSSIGSALKDISFAEFYTDDSISQTYIRSNISGNSTVRPRIVSDYAVTVKVLSYANGSNSKYRCVLATIC